jgi:hypothetical protein
MVLSLHVAAQTLNGGLYMPKMEIPRRGGGQAKPAASRRAKNESETETIVAEDEGQTLITLEATHVNFRRMVKHEDEGTENAHIYHKPIKLHTALINEVNPSRPYDHIEDGIEAQGVPTCKISFVDNRPEIVVLGDFDFVDYAINVANRDGNFDGNYIDHIKGTLDLHVPEPETEPDLSEREVVRAYPSRDDDDAPVSTLPRGGSTRPSATKDA